MIEQAAQRPWFLLLALALIGGEIIWYRFVLREAYPWNVAGASTGIWAGHLLTNLLNKLLLSGIFIFVWEHRLTTVSLKGPAVWLGFFLLVEFVYYWFHRVSHTCRWLWASHIVHHSAERLTLTSAYRLGWTSVLSGAWVFWVPVVWLGFPPQAVFGMVALNLVYQFWLHTETIPRLGWFDTVFNPPSNHRVHHASNAAYLDKNFGGVVIFWDHLFGTYQAERTDEACRFGLVKPTQSNNPFTLALTEWGALASDAIKQTSWQGKFRAAFGRPA